MRYYSANRYFKQRFDTKVYKISLDAGMTCPNRDGTLDTRGCIFCSDSGSGDFAAKQSADIFTQINSGISLVKHKCKSEKYIAYFQSFSNTYAPASRLKALFTKAISHPSIVGLSVATRPDCINNDVLLLLDELNKQKPVMVELGLQTIHLKSAEYIRRGYTLPVFDKCVKSLQDLSIHTIVHIILGLPNETEEMMLKTADYVGKSGANGIKLQLLHVLKNTDLAKDYLKGNFQALSLEQYAYILGKCVSVLPKDMVIHRLTGDGPKKSLIAPLWSKDKKTVLNTINRHFEENNIVQGSF